MQLPTPLYAGRLMQRYKRFLADITMLEGPDRGSVITAHIADPGRLPGLAVADAKVWVSHHTDPKRRLAYSVQLIRHIETLVAVNTANANRLVAEALAAGTFSMFGPIATIAREPRRDPGTRLDFKLTMANRDTLWLEVKNVTWRRDDALKRPERARTGAFPDAVTARGRKHLEHLAAIAKGGERAALLFVAQRNDIDALTIAHDIDPHYARAVDAAREAGVEFHACCCQLNLSVISIHRIIPLVE